MGSGIYFDFVPHQYLVPTGNRRIFIIWTDTLIRFLGRKKPIVGANYRARNPPFFSTAVKGLKRVDTVEGSTGLEAVDFIGLAVTLIETRVFEAVFRPWFNFTYEDGIYGGEDYFFLSKARAAGFRPYIDHDLSKFVRHIANNELCFDSIPND